MIWAIPTSAATAAKFRRQTSTSWLRKASASVAFTTPAAAVRRAEILTGLYAHQAGVGHMAKDNHLPGYRGQLNDQCVSLAEAIKPAGYFVAMAGKWHVGFEHGCTPVTRGFDASLASPRGGFYYPEDKTPSCT